MAIRRFSVGPARGLRSAAWEGLPNLVIVAGPNGVGKSTLLHELWRRRAEFQEPETHVTYIGPHRPWRKATLAGAHLYQLPGAFREFLEMPSLPGWSQIAPPGLQAIGGQARTHDSVDEAFSLVKFVIAKKELRRVALMQQVFDTHDGSIPPGAFPDVYAELRRITRHLLPHLTFSRVDLSQEQDIRVLFRRTDADHDDVIDIDDLSSGEKAVIGLFLPFLERQIDIALGDVAGEEATVAATTLIDEPDIHLHATLQVALVDYMRSLARDVSSQFILTTHSPTILDSALDEELFMLAPVDVVGELNQFVRVASSEERLETIRSVAGATHLVTRGRPIVYLEGESPAAKAASDQRLVEILIPESASWVIVPGGGRGEAIRASRRLREATVETMPGVAVFALVDSDQALDDDPQYVISWPVAMIENLLLSPSAIWEVLAPYREHVPLSTEQDVAIALREIAMDLQQDEVRLRFLARIRPLRISLEVPSHGDALDTFTAARDRLQDELEGLGSEALVDAATIARQSVERIVDCDSALKFFRGKEILRRFHNRFVSRLGYGHRAFTYELARCVRQSGAMTDVTRPAVIRIQRFIPAGLSDLLAGLGQEQLPTHQDLSLAADLAARCRQAKILWDGGKVDATLDYGTLRTDAFQVVRRLREQGEQELSEDVLRLAVQVGTGSIEP